MRGVGGGARAHNSLVDAGTLRRTLTLTFPLPHFSLSFSSLFPRSRFVVRVSGNGVRRHDAGSRRGQGSQDEAGERLQAWLPARPQGSKRTRRCLVPVGSLLLRFPPSPPVTTSSSETNLPFVTQQPTRARLSPLTLCYLPLRLLHLFLFLSLFLCLSPMRPSRSILFSLSTCALPLLPLAQPGQVEGGRVIRVTFDGGTADTMPWKFRPTQGDVKVIPTAVAMST